MDTNQEDWTEGGKREHLTHGGCVTGVHETKITEENEQNAENGNEYDKSEHRKHKQAHEHGENKQTDEHGKEKSDDNEAKNDKHKQSHKHKMEKTEKEENKGKQHDDKKESGKPREKDKLEKKESLKEKLSGSSQKSNTSQKSTTSASSQGTPTTPDTPRRRSSGRNNKMELSDILEDGVFIDIPDKTTLDVLHSRSQFRKCSADSSDPGTPTRTPKLSRKSASVRNHNGRIPDMSNMLESEISSLLPDRSPRVHRSARRTASEPGRSSHRRTQSERRRPTRRESDRRKASVHGDPRTGNRLVIDRRQSTSSEGGRQSRKGSSNASSIVHAEIMRRPSRGGGPYMSPGLNITGSYKTPGAEILIASLIIGVGIVTMIVSWITKKKVWLIVGAVCMSLGGLCMILGCCWCCAAAQRKEDEETPIENRVVTMAEIASVARSGHKSSPKPNPKNKHKPNCV